MVRLTTLFFILLLFLTRCTSPIENSGKNGTPIPTNTPPPTASLLSPTIPSQLSPTPDPPSTAPPLLPTIPYNSPISNYLADPVVLTGAELPALLGLPPQNITAWRYTPNGWQQISVQVDERALIALGSINNRPDQAAPVILTYTDPNSSTGADPNPTLDEDDQLVFMVKEAGDQHPEPFTPPPHTLPNLGVHITLADPTDLTQTGYIYLFAQDGTLDPTNGQPSITYLTTRTGAGDNGKKKEEVDNTNSVTEDSQIITPYYRHHFSARWVLDELVLFTGNRPTSDILDRFRVQLRPGDCDRSENSFSNGRGFFLVNKSGPVRVIRSYFGANSGSYTQRQHIFYEQRQDLTTFLRVHTIPGVMDLIDYSPEAIGMSYYNNLNLDGVVIDGVADEVSAGTLEWELVTGDQGSLLIFHKLETDMPRVATSSFYQDELASPQCTGDRDAYGLSGTYYFPIQCTDPARAAIDPNNCPTAYTFTSHHTLYYELPHISVETTRQRYSLWQTPVIVAIQTIE